MMLAVRLKGDVAQQHDLVIAADLFEGARQMDRRILAIAAAIFLPRPRDPLGRVEQALARRIVARPFDQRPHRRGDMIGDHDLAVGSDFGRAARHIPAFTVAFLPHISGRLPG